MSKIKLKFEVVVEYEPNLELCGCSTIEELLAIDLANAEDDPLLMISDNAIWTISGEVVDNS